MNRIKAKIKNMSVVSRAAIAFTLASVLERAVQMITSPIFTRLMTTEQYGTVTLYNSYAEIIGLFALLSLSEGIYNNAMLEFKDDRDSYIKTNMILSNIATGITFLSVIALRSIIDYSVFPFDNTYLFIMFSLFLVKPAFRFWLGRSKYEYRYISVFVSSVVILVVTSIVSILFTIVSNDKSLGRIIGRDATYFLVFIVFAVLTLKKGKIKKKYMAYGLKYSLPLLPFHLSKYVLNHFDQVMIASMVDKSSSGIYSIAYSAGFAIKILWEAINSATIPWRYQKLSENRISDIRKTTNVFFWFYCVVTLLVCLFAPEIMMILASPAYSEGVYCIPPVAIGVFFVGINSWFGSVLMYKKRIGTLSYVSIGLGVLNVGLNYVGIKYFGYIAAAYTTLICYSIQCLIMYLLSNQLVKGVYSWKTTILISSVTVGLGISSMLLYKLFIVRYVIIIALCVIGVYMYKKINLFKRGYTITSNKE